jgi:hypothetical protein
LATVVVVDVAALITSPVSAGIMSGKAVVAESKLYCCEAQALAAIGKALH